jgi:hypothetical protein
VASRSKPWPEGGSMSGRTAGATRVHKTGGIRRISAKFSGFGPNRFQKPVGYTVHNFKFFEKKNWKKYVKNYIKF